MRDDPWQGVRLLAGTAYPSAEPWPPFAPPALDFLAALSGRVMARAAAARQEELAAFGFWCRRAHLKALAERHAVKQPRLGRGLILHFAPSNVPTLFGYTYAIGLLAGCAGLVRLSGRRGAIEQALCELIAQTLDQPEFSAVRARSGFVSYPRDDGITQALLAGCDGRVIWGGDETVAALRRLPMPPRAVEVCFADRWSLALLSQREIDGLDAETLGHWAHHFYNDTFLMDQNACSSPQLVVWLRDGGSEAARRRWWNAVAEAAAARYELDAWRAARRYERFCLAAMDEQPARLAGLERYQGGLVLVARLACLPAAPSGCRGGFGLFFEADIETAGQLLPLLTPKVQTIVCGGPAPAAVAQALARGHARGGDRAVPLGQALAIDTIWDGHDLIAELSRCIG